MSWSIGLNFGESFAEVVAQRDTQRHSHRWYLPKLGLATGLESFFQIHSITEVSRFRLATKLASQILQRRIGSAPAFLTTAGFENWLEMNLPIQTKYITAHPRRSRSPLDRDIVFGISERTNAEGQVDQELDLKELEFLVAKLKMSEVENVALGFLHSNKNPENEKKAASYLEGEGFQVFTSHHCSNIENERARWWQAILNAYVAPAFTEVCSEIQNYLRNKLNVSFDIEILATNGEFLLPNKQNLISSMHGSQQSLLEFCQTKSLKSDHVLYCGLEDFWLLPLKSQESQTWDSEFGQIAFSSPTCHRLRIQPTQRIDQSFWGCAALADAETGYEPGPMCMGRGLSPTLLDVLHIQDRLLGTKGLSEHITSTSSTRIFENLLAFSREAASVEDFRNHETAGWIEETALESWFMEIFEHTDGRSLHLCGPLAKSVGPLLKKYMDNVKVMKLDDDILAQSILAPDGAQ